MSDRAKMKLGTDNPSRWMAEVSYTNGREMLLVTFEEIEHLDEIIEHGPDWNEIEHIIITLNRSSAEPVKEAT